jgi:hypothetical protein
MYHVGKFAIAAVSAMTAVLAGLGPGDTSARYAEVQQVAERRPVIVFPSTTAPKPQPVTVKPRVTPTTTTTTTTTTTIPVAPHRGADQMCPEWHQTALQVGWAPEDLPKLSYVLWRESRCDPTAHNTKDPTPDGSRGLSQINGYWCRVNQFNPEGFLQAHGVLDTCADLHDPVTNLTAALTIWRYGRNLGRSGWGPWAVK